MMTAASVQRDVLFAHAQAATSTARPVAAMPICRMRSMCMVEAQFGCHSAGRHDGNEIIGRRFGSRDVDRLQSAQPGTLPRVAPQLREIVRYRYSSTGAGADHDGVGARAGACSSVLESASGRLSVLVASAIGQRFHDFARQRQ